MEWHIIDQLKTGTYLFSGDPGALIQIFGRKMGGIYFQYLLEVKMRVASLLFALLISGCTTVDDEKADPYTVVLEPKLCGYLASQKTAGLIVMDYNSSFNTVRYENVKSGVVVSNIIVGSSADSSDIEIGDVITRVNGEVIYSQDQFANANRSSDDLIEYTVTDDESEKQVEIKKDFFSKLLNGCSHKLRLPNTIHF